MSTIEDLRKVLQDMVAPDLKAITVRLDAVEKSMTERFGSLEHSIANRFTAADQRFDSVEHSIGHRFSAMDQRFDSLEQSIAHRFDAFDHSMAHRFDSVETMAAMRQEAMLLRIELASQRAESNQTLMLKALDIDRRMEQLEARVAPKSAGPALEQHA